MSKNTNLKGFPPFWSSAGHKIRRFRPSDPEIRGVFPLSRVRPYPNSGPAPGRIGPRVARRRRGPPPLRMKIECYPALESLIPGRAQRLVHPDGATFPASACCDVPRRETHKDAERRVLQGLFAKIAHASSPTSTHKACAGSVPPRPCSRTPSYSVYRGRTEAV